MDDYDSMAKREIIKAKQEKGMMYVEMNLLFVCSPTLMSVRKIGGYRNSGRTMQN